MQCDRATFYIPSHNIPLCTTSHILYQHILHLIPHHSTSHLPSLHYTSCTNHCHNAPHIAHHSHIIIHHGCITCRVCSSGVQSGGEKSTTSHIMHTVPTHSTPHISYHTITHHAPIFATMHNIAHHSHIIIHHSHITCKGMQQQCAICGGVMWCVIWNVM